MLPFKTILFPTDFSPASEVAFEFAGALARDYRARMIVMHVIEPVAMGFAEYMAYVGTEDDKAEVTTRLEAIKAPSPHVTLDRRLFEGEPATVIVEEAKELAADLVVMGTHGRTGFTRFVMGSVAEEVLRRAPCPVLTVRGAVEVKAAEPVEELPETAML